MLLAYYCFATYGLNGLLNVSLFDRHDFEFYSSIYKNFIYKYTDHLSNNMKKCHQNCKKIFKASQTFIRFKKIKTQHLKSGLNSCCFQYLVANLFGIESLILVG